MAKRRGQGGVPITRETEPGGPDARRRAFDEEIARLATLAATSGIRHNAYTDARERAANTAERPEFAGISFHLSNWEGPDGERKVTDKLLQAVVNAGRPRGRRFVHRMTGRATVETPIRRRDGTVKDYETSRRRTRLELDVQPNANPIRIARILQGLESFELLPERSFYNLDSRDSGLDALLGFSGRIADIDLPEDFRHHFSLLGFQVARHSTEIDKVSFDFMHDGQPFAEGCRNLADAAIMLAGENTEGAPIEWVETAALADPDDPFLADAMNEIYADFHMSRGEQRPLASLNLHLSDHYEGGYFAESDFGSTYSVWHPSSY